jgi:hypothetical protein
MGVLLCTPGVLEHIRELTEYALAHRFNRAMMAAAMRRGYLTLDEPRYSVVLPIHYHLTLTVEEHHAGWFKHLSISVSRPGKVPNRETCAKVLEMAGICRPLESCMVYETPCESQEEPGPKPPMRHAVNILVPLEEGNGEPSSTDFPL